MSHCRDLRYVEYGRGDVPVVLLHGLFGSPENWRVIMEELADEFYFFAVQFPIDHSTDRCYRKFRGIEELTDYVEDLFDELSLEQAVLCGNSLGGQVAVDFGLRWPRRVERLILTGSAGLFERSLSNGKRPKVDREVIRARAAEIFFDEKHVTDEIVEEVYAMLSDRRYARFLIRLAKATRDRNMKEELRRLHLPTLIIWGKDDRITPPCVAEEFRQGIADARLAFLDRCGHAPPIEQPLEFSRLVREFLQSPAPSVLAENC